MFLAHYFRLRDPWQCAATEQGVRWSRLFHRPTGLEEDDELWLVISGLPSDALVNVNGHAFTTNPAAGEPPSPCATGILPVPAAGTSAASTTGGSRTAPPAAQYNVTSILSDANQIEILLPPHDPLPATDSFPYNARLGVVGHS